MNEVIIRILDNSNNVLGDLDLKDFNDFPLVITKGIVNLDNLKTRTGTYTKSFKVPNTRNNSVLLSNTDDINSRKDYKDALGRKPCSIMVNGNEIEKGFVQVSKSYNGFDVDSFELVFFGNNIDWVKQAAELKVNDIPFLNNAQVYNVDGIKTANFKTFDTGYDHCYPYISRGGQSPSNDTQVEDYYPCFYLRSILERGLNYMGENVTGWNVVSNFLDDDNVKKLACDLNGDMKVSQSVVDDSKTRATKTSDFEFYGSNGPTLVKFQDDFTFPNEDNNGNYNLSTGEYTVPTTGRYTVDLSLITGDFSEQFGREEVDLRVILASGTGTNYQVNTFLKDDKTVSLKIRNSNGTQADDENNEVTLSAVLQAGEKASIFITYQPFTASGRGYLKSDSYFKIQRSFELVEGDDFNLTDVIPDDIKLIDVINDFTRMFNIYYWTDIKTRTIYLEPRNTFFKDTTSALDWSNKLDLSKMYEIDYVSSYKRNLTFSYKDLDGDEWLKGWEKTYKRKYGEYTYKLPNRFGEGTTKIKLDLFSASYQYIAGEATPLNESPFTTLRYWNEYITTPPSERIDGYNSRVFNFQHEEQYDLSGKRRSYSINGRTSNFIPYAMFEDYNNTDAPINLSFTGNDGLFNTYYSNMLKNIEEGGRLVAYFNLNSTDIDNLDFRKLVYIDAPAQAKGYYLVERVEDFNPINNGLTKVSLFKYENLGSVELDNSQQGNNNSSDDNASQETLEPIYIEDRGFLVGVFNENSNGLIEKVLK